MNRILLGTTLLLTAGLFGHSVQAQATPPAPYVANSSIVSPGSGTYTCFYPQVLDSVTFAVTNQYVEANGAAPNSSITVSWSMTDVFNNVPAFADDYGSNVPVPIDVTGHWRRYLNNTSPGNFSRNLLLGQGSYTFSSNSGLIDPKGNSHITIVSAHLQVYDAI